ncbi:MAG: signal recognition particle-docking protein FtsY, partial [Candidatus Woesearchaeota archaeon]
KSATKDTIETKEAQEKKHETTPQKSSKEPDKVIAKEKETIEETLEKEKEPVAVSEEEFNDLEKELPKEKKSFFGMFSKKKKEDVVEESDAEKEVEEKIQDTPEKESDVQDVSVTKQEAEAKEDSSEESIESEEKEDTKEGFFGSLKKTFTKKLSQEKFEELFWDIEITLLENNVSLEVVEKIKEDMSNNIVGKNLSKNEILDHILKSIKQSITELFSVPGFDLVDRTNDKKPLIISFVGVNGSGKTTQLAKVAKMLLDNNKTCVVAACDTFRAAAIQQLEEHTKNLGVRLIKHDYGADAAAVAFDAIEHAKAKGIDVVLLDTAGRLHSNENLMKELEKLMRVANPDINIFVGESITGNDCVEQAKQWSEHVRIDGIILTKADVDEKGGAAISISYVIGKPIVYLGTGQGYDDIEKFDYKLVLKTLDL